MDEFWKQLGELKLLFFLASALCGATTWLIHYRTKILKNCKVTGSNSKDILSIKEEIPLLVLKTECEQHHVDIITEVTKEIKQLKVDDLEDKIMFIEFRTKEGTATTADKVMLNQHIRRLEALRQ